MFFPQTSVVLGVLAALVEDLIWNLRNGKVVGKVFIRLFTNVSTKVFAEGV